MKISYITMQFPVPSETFASLDVESLRQQGQDVAVYGMRPKHSQFERLMSERGHADLRVVHFSLPSVVTFLIFLFRHSLMFFSLLWWVFSCCSRTPNHLFKSVILLPSAISIFSAVYKDKPDVVHLFWGHYPSMVGYLVKRYMPDTVVSMFLGAHDLVSAYPGSAKLLAETDVVFTHSKSNVPMITELGIDASKANVVVRGTKLDFPIECVVKKFEQLNVTEFLTAGRLIEEKGVDDVLRIFQGVLKTYPEAVLHIAGDGPFKPSLEKLVVSLSLEKHVVFHGHLEQVKLIKLMSTSHFFVLMSRYPSERLPNVLKEAMYQECVVVTTNTNGIDELVDHDVDGFIVGAGDYKAALACVNACLADHEIAKSIAVSARKKIKEKFDVNFSMHSYLNLWKNAQDRKRLL